MQFAKGNSDFAIKDAQDSNLDIKSITLVFLRLTTNAKRVINILW